MPLSVMSSIGSKSIFSAVYLYCSHLFNEQWSCFMVLFKRFSLLIICLQFFIVNSHATELQQGVQYNSGENLTASKAGIGFTIPQGWSGSISNEGDFIMKSNQHYGMLILTTTSTNNRNIMASSLSQESLDIGSGYVFYPSGNAKIESNGITQNYQGKDPSSGALLKGHLHVLEGGYGQSVTIVVMGAAIDSNYNNQLLHNTLNTVDFFNPDSQQQHAEYSQKNKKTDTHIQTRPVIENWSGGGYVEGVNSDGQNCSYVTAGGMSMKSCD